MSSISRTQSLRNPTASGEGALGHRDVSDNSRDAKTSPSRLPHIKGLTRSSTTTERQSRTGTAVAGGGRPRPLSGIYSSSSKPSTGSGTNAAAGAEKTGRSIRPLSGVFSGRSTSTMPKTATSSIEPLTKPSIGRPASTRQISAPTTRTSTSDLTKPLPRPTPTSSIRQGPSANSRTQDQQETKSRPLSLSSALPAPSSPPKPQITTHTRTRSSATSLTAATTLHPPATSTSRASLASTTSNSSGGNTAPARQKDISSSKPPVSGRTQSSSSHHRSRGRASSSSVAPTRNSAAATANRPAFDTHQQHYSPLKNPGVPKPLTSTFLAPPSPSKLPSNVALSAETSRLQTELLQLSLLHRDARKVCREWHDSARRKLGARFEKLVGENRELSSEERDVVEERNVLALLRWARQGQEQAGGGVLSLEEKLGLLDQILNGVWGLSEPGGRYEAVVRAFENWADKMSDLVALHKSADVGSLANDKDGRIVFIDELENRWKRDAGGLVRKLEGWRRGLGELGDPPPPEEDEGGQRQRSSLERILTGCKSMVDDMLAELNLMEQIERDALEMESEWIDRMNEELTGPKSGGNDTQGVQLWQLCV